MQYVFLLPHLSTRNTNDVVGDDDVNDDGGDDDCDNGYDD